MPEINNKTFFLNTLKQLGIKVTPNLQQLVNNAVAKQYTSSSFMFYLRQTKEYRHAFTGIFKKDGTLKMSEAQYLSAQKQFENIASKAGVDLTPKMRDWLFVNNVSPSEFGDRATAYSRLKRNNDLYRAFEAELTRKGAKDVNRKNMLKFILGVGNEKWYDTWNDAVTRNAAQMAGLAVGRKNALDALPQGIIERISGMGLSQSALNQGFEALADDIATWLPESQARGAGLTASDFVTLRFGGKNRMQIKEKVDTLIASRNLDNEQKASAQLIQTAPGKTTLAYGGLSGDEGE